MKVKDTKSPAQAVVQPLGWQMRMRAVHRLGIVVAVATLAYLLLPPSIDWSIRFLSTWDLGAFVYLALAWMAIAHADAASTRRRVQTQDQSGFVIFVLVLVAACTSILAIGMVAHSPKDIGPWLKAWHLTLSLLALVLSWLLIHSLFAFHYARQFYGIGHGRDTHRGGLSFPGDQPPDYLDFAYQSFVVGMTSQVSDVPVTTREMRRLTLIHGVLSFIFNVAIVSLSINIIAGALQTV